MKTCAATLGSSASQGSTGGGAVTQFYAESTNIETFASQKGNRPELAYLLGARLVVVNEIPSGKALESRTLKAWTGGDALEATPKYGHLFSKTLSIGRIQIVLEKGSQNCTFCTVGGPPTVFRVPARPAR